MILTLRFRIPYAKFWNICPKFVYLKKKNVIRNSDLVTHVIDEKDKKERPQNNNNNNYYYYYYYYYHHHHHQ